MATPKIDRQPPTRIFEHYVLTKTISNETTLTPVRDSVFELIPGINVLTSSYGYDLVSDLTEIGFNFEFDEKTYTKMCISTQGWFALASPTATSSNQVQDQVFYFTGSWPGVKYLNSHIKEDNTTDSVLCCPWFGTQDMIVNDAAYARDDNRLILSASKLDWVKSGLVPPPNLWNQTFFGTRIFREHGSPEGRKTIIRWSSTDYSKTTTLRYEAVVYENGKIEFRYAPHDRYKKSITQSTLNNGLATCGIFSSGIRRFRDFAHELGYKIQQRTRYKYGGATYVSAFFDSGTVISAAHPLARTVARPYAWRMTSNDNWPAQGNMGAMFTFSPPMNRRRVLPRKELRKLDTNLKHPQNSRPNSIARPSMFDDRETPVFVDNVTVNYPTTLPRFFGETSPETLARQDLFVGQDKDFDVTGSISKNCIDGYVGQIIHNKTITPFNEHSHTILSSGSHEDIFYVSGSEGFTGITSDPLWSKQQIRLTLPVNNTTQLLATTASILYYNSANKMWLIPQNSYTASLKGDGTYTSFVPPHHHQWLRDGRVIEDHRGFGPIGNYLGSGSIFHRDDSWIFTDPLYDLNPYTAPILGSDTYVNAPFSRRNALNAIERFYDRSVCVHPAYEARIEETIDLNISQPFLIEKAIIELPIACGDSWFNDKTTSFLPLHHSHQEQIYDPPYNLYPATAEYGTSGSFDFAGPGLTVALFNQVKTGAERRWPIQQEAPTWDVSRLQHNIRRDNSTRRDLILSATITHINDMTTELVLSNFPPHTATYQMRPTGWLSYSSEPTFVINPTTTSSYTFTGSIALKTDAAISNGVIVRYVLGGHAGFGDGLSNGQQIITGALQPEYIHLFDSTASYAPWSTSADQWGRWNGKGYRDYTSIRIAYIDPIGRGATGFEPSGRSIFGKEYVSITQSSLVKNPFHLTGSAYDALVTRCEAAGIKISAVAAIPFMSHDKSPYLVMPGDKLVLAFAKSRPYIYHGSRASGSFRNVLAVTHSGSATHDVQLITGAINITLFGTFLRESAEYNNTPSQLSCPIFENICDEPVLDQFDVPYADELIGTIYDDYVTGSLINVVRTADNRSKYIISASLPCGRVFSKYLADFQQVPDLSAHEIFANPSKNFRLQPWFERVGNARIISHVDNTERFWDSMMPSIKECWNADGTYLFVSDADSGAGIGDIDRINSGSTAFTYLFDHYVISVFEDEALQNVNWLMSFPYEPRYATASRQKNVEKSFIAEKSFDGGGTVTSITPRQLDKLMPIIGYTRKPSNVQLSFDVFGDAMENQFKGSYVATGSMNIDDIARVLFGFGDRNYRMYTDDTPLSSDPRYCTHAPDFKQRNFSATVVATFFYSYVFKPIIRGWKYGVYSGIAAYSKAYFRRNRYGQFRDMLEQRLFTTYYFENVAINTSYTRKNSYKTPLQKQKSGIQAGPVEVRFLDYNGRTTDPLKTWSQNLDRTCTSSLPFFDGLSVNRPPIDPTTLNLSTFIASGDSFGNIFV